MKFLLFPWEKKDLRQDYVFEIHNGRFFKGILGEWYILLLPLGSLLLVFITMSGVIDWLYHRKK